MMLFWKKNMKQLSVPSSICLTLTALLALIVFCIRPGESSVLTEMEKPVPIRNVEAVLGGIAELPCDVTPEDVHDDVYLILWFKDEASKPMYSLDVRGKPLGQAQHWSESTSLGKRTSFRTSSPNGLLVEGLKLKDEGIYRCRVDYRNSPTKNVKLNLTIIVPPNIPMIRNKSGKIIGNYEVGPFEIGQDLVLECEVKGGDPLPKVTWWQSGSLFDSSDEVTRTGVILNRMVYKSLTREDLGKTFTCQAANTNLTMPVSAEVKLIINLKPTAVSILDKISHVSADKEVEVTCQAVGGYPSPKLTWLLGSKLLRAFDESSYNGVSKSTLRYRPSVEDDGRYLTCRAENAALKKKPMHDQWTIHVHYAPQVSLRLGRTLDADNIRTGHDVYFECDVKANPPALRLEWLHNTQLLHQDPDKGIIMSTQSLVLQKVTREMVGDYVCRAVNTEGSRESNPVALKIMYAPVCSSDVDQLIGVTADESISINCRLDAYPPVVTFSWFFNNSDHKDELDEERFTTDGKVSTLNFTPTNNQDYGTLYCEGQNVIGHQEEPCTFQIVPTGRPTPLLECHVSNLTLSSIRVECKAGFDGGLPQTFLLEVYDRDNKLKTKVTNQMPIFEIANFDTSGLPVKMYVYAQNAKGSSEPFVLEETFKPSASISNSAVGQGKRHKHAGVEGVTDSKAVTGSKSTLDITPSTNSLVVIITGVSTGIVFTILVVCLFVTCRRKRRHTSSSHTSSSSNSSTNGNFNPPPTQRNETVAISNQNRRNTGQNNIVAGGKKSLLHRKSSNTSLHTTSNTSTNITSIENDRGDGGDREDIVITHNVEANHPYSVIGGGSRDGTIDRGNMKQMCTKRGGDRNFEDPYDGLAGHSMSDLDSASLLYSSRTSTKMNPVPQPQIPMGMPGASSSQQNSSQSQDPPSSYGHVVHSNDPTRCYHESNLSQNRRLPSLTEEQRVQQYQNNQHLNVEGWPLIPSNAQSSQSHFMTLGPRRSVNSVQQQPIHRCERGQPKNHRLTALSSQGYDSQCGSNSTFRDSLELSQKANPGDHHEYATLGVAPSHQSMSSTSSDGMSHIPSLSVAPMARGESLSSTTSTNASSNYPQYHHTNDKPKKRVTIVESNNSESCV